MFMREITVNDYFRSLCPNSGHSAYPPDPPVRSVMQKQIGGSRFRRSISFYKADMTEDNAGALHSLTL